MYPTIILLMVAASASAQFNFKPFHDAFGSFGFIKSLVGGKEAEVEHSRSGYEYSHSNDHSQKGYFHVDPDDNMVNANRPYGPLPYGPHPGQHPTRPHPCGQHPYQQHPHGQNPYGYPYGHGSGINELTADSQDGHYSQSPANIDAGYGIVQHTAE